MKRTLNSLFFVEVFFKWNNSMHNSCLSTMFCIKFVNINRIKSCLSKICKNQKYIWFLKDVFLTLFPRVPFGIILHVE